MKPRLPAALLALLFVFGIGVGHDEGVTEAQLQAAHAAYLEARAAGFSVESMVRLYSLDNAARAVKKLVDAAQSNPGRSIPAADSAAMEATREQMNLKILEHLADVTGGTIEVINFGKQNGIRSDKDQTLFAVDGKRLYTATELREAYGDRFLKEFGIDMEKMDMSLFDGDAAIPDWRRADMSYEEFVAAYERGQAMLEQNPEAYTEAGSFRAQVDRRTAEQGRVTLVRKNPETGEIEVVRGRAAEVSSRYAAWTADVPYRNAMDATVENKGRFDHSGDFIDKMKYFNRTVGDGMNALALEDWDVNYIFHLAELAPGARKDYVDRLVRDVFVIDASPAEQEMMKFVILTAAEIEIDKMKGQTKAESHYLQRLVAVEEDRARAAGEEIEPTESLKRARERFFGHQRRVMDLGIVVTTRQKMIRDLDPVNLRRVARKYGADQARKLRYETARQIRRAFERIEDPVLLDRLVAEAPAKVRAEIETLRDVARSRRRDRERQERRRIRLAVSDEAEARRTGPGEKILDRVDDETFMARRRRELNELLDRTRQRYTDFDAELRSGRYTDDYVSDRLRARVLDSLGFEERAVLERMEVEYERRFSGSKLVRNVVNLGNLASALAMIEVYQQTGDLTMVARTALWELVCNVPGVAQFATLRQSFNDGNVESLSWLFIAWKLPGAGQVKMAFDVTKQAMTIVYNHAMIPLANDRFAQVYMGYVDAQPAGWSPLVPGWKERREAASLSILQLVPGDNFEEKRSGMYAFFQARLDEKLRRNGLEPTTDAYWERRDQVLPAFFGSYVEDYFEARNDFYENTAAGLRAIADLPELKRRLIDRLVADFQQGEINDRLAEVAREEMMAAIARIEGQQRENLALERQVIAVEDMVTESLQAAFEQGLDATAVVEDGAAAARVEVQAYPPAVIEGQQVTFAVKALSADDDEGGGEHQIEVRRLAAQPILRGERADKKDKLMAAMAEGEAMFLKPLLDRPDADAAELYLTRVDYEVVVKTPSGRVSARETLSVKVAGLVAEERETGDAVTLKVRITEEVAREERQRNSLGAQVRVRWEDPSPENLTPRSYRPKQAYGAVVFLWLRWDEMPEGKRYGVHLHAQGGIPRFELDFHERLQGYAKFVREGDHPEAGNCFLVHPRLPEWTGGRVRIDGELLAYERRMSIEDMAAGTEPPVARMPFSTEVVFHPPALEASARASVNGFGLLSGSVTVKYCQSGLRPGRVDLGGRSFHGRFGNGMDFSFNDMWSIPDRLTVTFRDFGCDRSLEVPITAGTVKPREVADQRNLPRLLADLERCMKMPDVQAANIARIHGDLSRTWTPSAIAWTDRDKWLAEVRSQMDWMERAWNAMTDVRWKGWNASGDAIPFRGRYVGSGMKAGEAERNAVLVRAEYRALMSHVLREKATVTLAMRDLELSLEFIEGAEAIAREVDGDLQKVLAQNLISSRSDYARRHYEAHGDLEAALALYQKAEDWRKVAARLSGHPYESTRFLYDVGDDFDRGED